MRCRRLGRIEFSKQCRLERIDQECFRESAIRSVALPAALKVVQAGAFYRCEYLKQILLNPGLETLGSQGGVGVFYYTALERVLIPQHVKELGRGTFGDCRRLQTVAFEGNSALERIGDHCFTGSQIEQILLPRGLRSIGTGAFADCPALRLACTEEGCGVALN